MSESSTSIREVFAHPKLSGLPNKEVSPSTMASLLKTFKGFSSEERHNAERFIKKSVEGSSGGSLGAFGKGEATATYQLLRDRVETPVLREFDHRLEEGGYEFRFPLAVVRSILHDKTPYEGFEEEKVGVSEDVINFNLCKDAEAQLYDALQLGGATIIISGDTPFMLAKLHKVFGKSVALCMTSEGPFVEGVLYSPAVTADGKSSQLRREFSENELTIPREGFAKQWYISRPVQGRVPPVWEPDVPEEDAMMYFKKNIGRYPFTFKPEIDIHF